MSEFAPKDPTEEKLQILKGAIVQEIMNAHGIEATEEAIDMFLDAAFYEERASEASFVPGLVAVAPDATTESVLAALEQSGYAPATTRELVTYVAAHPEAKNVLALGTRVLYRGNTYFFMVDESARPRLAVVADHPEGTSRTWPGSPQALGVRR